MNKMIEVRGARVNNLNNIDVSIPQHKLTCFFGPSGSGKTSLAFHTLFSESKRRFLNSFPTYLKFFSDRPAPVDVDLIKPVLPVFGLPQINPVIGTRSVVADVMHLTELLQNLFYHYSKELCSIHQEEFIEKLFSDEIKSLIQENDETFYLLVKKDDFVEHFSKLPFPSRSLKSKRSRKVDDFDSDHEFWEVVRFKQKHVNSLDEKAKQYLEAGISIYLYAPGVIKFTEVNYQNGQYECASSGCFEKKLKNKSPMNFSPYNALGACSDCSGFGEILEYDEEKLVDRDKSVNDGAVKLLSYKRFSGQEDPFKKVLRKNKISLTKPLSELPEKFWEILYEGEDQYNGFNKCFRYLESKRYKMHVRVFIRGIQIAKKCSSCSGSRLNKTVSQFFLSNKYLRLNDLFKIDIQTLYLELIDKQVFYSNSKEFKKNYDRILDILKTAIGVGLGHLSLNRKSKTLSAGEYQRLLLLKYLSYEGTGALFIFDEPSLGLSVLEQKELLKGFRKLISGNNTVIVVDHSEFFQKKSDYLIQMGPGSGKAGGEVLYQGETSNFKWITEKKVFKVEGQVDSWLEVDSPKIYDKKYKSFKLPNNGITWVRGPSGSGKTGCLINTLANRLHYNTYDKYLDRTRGFAKNIINPTPYENVIIVDANLNRYTSRSTVGSMTELFGVVRKHYAKTAMAKALGLKDGHFSSHSDLGQCPKCEGKGVSIIEMQFLEDIILTCEDCDGKKLKPIYSSITDGKLTVHEAFSKPISEVLKNIKLTPKFQKIAEYLKILNLDYLSLDRQINSLSGGEKQRIYLLNKLLKNIENSIIFFENISFGLSDRELFNLCEFLQGINKKSNTLVIIDQEELFKSISHHTIKF